MAPGKRIRFEVFKRDSFQCQYCGRTPPSVILTIDHIIPRADGGPDTTANYITACADCNVGKGSVRLEVAPQPLKKHLAALRERRAQVKAYTKFLEQLEAETNTALQAVNETFQHYFPHRTLSHRFLRTTVKTFLRHLPPIKVSDAMDLACSRFNDAPAEQERAIKYFCGICWNWIKRPETRGW